MLPLLGIVTFALFYSYSVTLYPGGNKFDPNAIGYSFFLNFWCDLLDSKTYSGIANPARPYALTATFILCLSMIPFWLSIPKLFNKQITVSRLSRYSGCFAMLVATLIFTTSHDLVIDVAAFFSFIALTASLVGLFRIGRRILFSLGLLTFVFIGMNFTLWQWQLFPKAIPGVQKMAFITFFIWVIATSLTSRDQNEN